MVGFSHLSDGTSVCSPSRDGLAAFGVSCPDSPIGSVGNDLILPLSSSARLLDLEGGSGSSSGDASILVGANNVCLDESNVSQIFKAVHHFSKNDRLAMVDEREKNLNLMAFISSLGCSMQDVNNFVHGSAKSTVVNDDGIREVLPAPGVGVSEPSSSDLNVVSDASISLSSSLSLPMAKPLTAPGVFDSASGFHPQGNPLSPSLVAGVTGSSGHLLSEDGKNSGSPFGAGGVSSPVVGLEEGELCQDPFKGPSDIGVVRPSWSSIVARGSSNLSCPLSFFPLLWTMV